MDALQAISSAAQIVSSIMGAVGALERARRDLDEAPKRIQSLAEFVHDLENLTRRIKQKHAYKLQNAQLDQKIQSFNGLVERLHPKIMKARKLVPKNRIKNFAKIVWNSMAGDPLRKIVDSIKDDLNWWLETQRFSERVENIIDSSAKNIPVRLKINIDQSYPISNKCNSVKSLLEKDGYNRVILIVGLSGIGKSCLARQVAADPPPKFVDGAVELKFGQWCSRTASDGCKIEYQKRLARRLCKFLVQIGFWKKIRDNNSGDLEYICCLLQQALCGKSILILLDDVWEQDIVERFTKLYDNNCRYLVTTRNESVYEITEAEKIELGKDDMREISKAILLYHNHLKEDELPGVSEMLLERCGHHPLTVAVMGKALRKEIRTEKWEKAITNLSTYATSAPGPISYVNEKEAENTVTVFGSFEFSLEAMTHDSRRLFIALAALSWAEPVPEGCLEAIWSVIGKESLFPIIICKLVEGSLFMKSDDSSLYQVHDMVSLYLEGKLNDSVKALLTDSTHEGIAFISPWLYIFGKEAIKKLSEQKIVFFLFNLEEKHVIIILESIIKAFTASISISELEASRAAFARLLGSRIANLISTDSQELTAVSAKVIANIFSECDYCNYFPSLESVGAVDKLSSILENCMDPMIQTSISTVLAKLSEFGSVDTIDQVLQRIPFHQLAELLSPEAEKWHESLFITFMSLIKAGKLIAVERMLMFDIDKSLIKLLELGSEVSQHHAIATLKVFYELGGPSASGALQPDNLELLPWQARFHLEKFTLSDRNVLPSPKPQTFEDLIRKVLGHDNKQVLEAMQDLIPIIERAGEPRMRDMIIQSPLIKRLSELLHHGLAVKNSMKSESAFTLMKLACSGGEPCIRKYLEHDIVPELIKMMQCNIAELQDSAYTALHQMLFGNGGILVLNQMIKLGLLERLVRSIESKSAKNREVCMHCILDIVEIGNKSCLESLLSLQVTEKIVKIEKTTGGSGETLVEFLKGIDKCKHISSTERRVMKQQVVRKVRVGMKGNKFEAQILSAVDACVTDGSNGASSSGGRHRR